MANHSPDTNWGTAPNLDVEGDTVGRVEWTLIQFDLPAFKPGVIINSAKLYAYHYSYTYDPGTVTIVIHRLLGPWDEGTVTWNNKPSYDSTIEATLTKTAGDWGWWIWDITELIKKWIQQGIVNYGLMLRMTAYTGTYGAVSFSSKENKLYPHGYLVIDYTPIVTSITLTAEKASVPLGSNIVLTGTLKDATGTGIGGETVTLQEYINGAWADVDSATTAGDGSFSFTRSGYGVGSYIFRAVYKGSLSYSGSTSPQVTVTVTKISTSITFIPNKIAIRVGETVSFSGTLYRSDTMAGVGGETVKLQKLVGGAWTDIRTTTTLSDGSYSFSETINEVGTFSYRAYYEGSAVYDSSTSTTRDIVVTKIPTSLTLTPDKLKSVVDGIINFLGKLTNIDTGTGVGGQTVKLQQLIGGVWNTILSGTTLSDGTVTFSRTMGSVGDFAFRLAYDGSAIYEPSTTDSVTVSVIKIPTILTFSANITQIYVGGEVQFYGSLIRSDTGEGVPDQTVELQKLEDNTWTTVDTRRTDSNGLYTFYVGFDTEGIFRYKAYFRGSDKHDPSDTTPIDITALMPTYPTILTLTASSLTAREGESITFSGYLKTETLEPIAAASIKLQQLSQSLWTDVGSTSTDERGFYSITYKFTVKGNYTFRTIFEGMDPYGPSSSTPTTVTILSAVEKVRPTRVMMRLDVSKTSITLGESIKLWGNLGVTSIMRTIPLPFQNVRVIADSTIIITSRTNITGVFEVEWKPDKAGTFDIYAEALTRLIGYKIAESNHVIVTVSA